MSSKPYSTPLDVSGDNSYCNYVLIEDNVLSGDAHVWAMNVISDHEGASLAGTAPPVRLVRFQPDHFSDKYFV